MSRVFRDTAWIVVAQVASRGLLFLTGVGCAWKMGASVFAEFSYLALTSAALTTYFAMGAGTAIIRYVAGAGPASPTQRMQNIAAAGLVGILGGVVAIFLIALVPALFLPESVAQLQVPLIAALAAQLCANLAAGVLVGEQRFAGLAYASMVSGTALVVVAGTGIALRSATMVIWSIPLSQLALLVATLQASAPHVAGSLRMLRIGSVLAGVPATLAFSAPVFLLSVLATTGPWALGLLLLRTSKPEFAAYSAGLQWFSLILVIPGALSSAYLPRLFRASSAGAAMGPTDNSVAIRLNVVQSVLVAATIAALALPLAGILIRFHGEVLRERRGVFVVFVIAAVISAATNPLGNGMVASNRQMTWLSLTAVWLVALAVFAWLIPVNNALLAGVDLCVGYLLLLLLAWLVRHAQKAD